MKPEQVKQVIEALLIASDKPLSLSQIKEVLEEVDPQIIKTQLAQLRQEYEDLGRSFRIIEVAGGYRISTNPEFAQWLNKLYATSRSERLSRPSLETLSIIAYRQPITRLEIEDIRGVNVDGVIKTLLERSLVRINGRKQIPGRPFLYGTTREFLEVFGLRSLEELPKLEEFGELVERTQAQPAVTEQGEGDVQTKDIAQENRSD